MNNNNNFIMGIYIKKNGKMEINEIIGLQIER